MCTQRPPSRCRSPPCGPVQRGSCATAYRKSARRSAPPRSSDCSSGTASGMCRDRRAEQGRAPHFSHPSRNKNSATICGRFADRRFCMSLPIWYDLVPASSCRLRSREFRRHLWFRSCFRDTRRTRRLWPSKTAGGGHATNFSASTCVHFFCRRNDVCPLLHLCPLGMAGLMVHDRAL